MPTKKQIFSKYTNPYFIETGSFMGDGIQEAVDAEYENIISIELSDKYFNICTSRFSNKNNVSIIKGDSFKMLPDIISKIDDNITFWLDGHHTCGDTALGEHWAPLMQELEVIKSHTINTHTIIIDDMRCWEIPNEVHGFYKEDIFRILNEINPDYEIVYEDGVEKDDILVAYIKNN